MSTIASLLNAIDSGSGNKPDRITEAINTQAPNTNSLLEGGDPIVFFPLRLETRFENSNLLVRVFPDDILINQLKTGLSDNEIKTGIRYWEERNKAKELDVVAYESKKEYLWNNVAALSSPPRASWIIRKTRPRNWVENNEVTNLLEFEETDALKKNIPTTDHLLPTRLVLIMETESNQIIVSEGLQKEDGGGFVEIPKNLALIPDLEHGEKSFKVTSDKLDGLSRVRFSLADEISWMSNFKDALYKGMAFDIPIQGVSKINWLLVVGVKEGLTGEEGSKALESLLRAHYYTSKGLTLVPQGTPTNNSEEDNSGYEQRYLVGQEDYLVYNPDKTIVSQQRQEQKTDQQRLAEGLGLSFQNSILCQTGPHRRAKNDNLPNHNGLADAREAALMNTALYPATLGYYTKYGLNGVFNTGLPSSLRSFYLEHVSGRGPLPALRRGKQPYGLVLCADMKNIPEPPADDAITRFIQLLEREITELAYQTMHIGQLYDSNGDLTDFSGTLNYLLRQNPTSVRYYKRKLIKKSDKVIASKLLFDQLWNSLVVPGTVSNADPLLLKLSEERVRREIGLFVCNKNEISTETDKLSETKFNVNYIKWLLNWFLGGGLKDSNNLNQRPTPDGELPLLFILLRSALIRQVEACVRIWLDHEEIKITSSENNSPLVPLDYLLVKLDQIYTQQELTGVPGHRDYTISNYLFNFIKDIGFNNVDNINDLNTFYERINGLREWIVIEKKLIKNRSFSEPLHSAYLELLDIITSLYVLSSMPTARLERCFAEHLDTLTYRTDAWITGLLSQKLDIWRVNNPLGIHIGAYGWLLDIRKQSKNPADGGYIHAPSLAQASSGALLKNGFKKYRFNEGAFAVDLSSDRAQRGLFLLEGLQEGYELPAILGYQFERAMHDAGLETELASLKNDYPLNNRRLIDQNNPITGTVIDGLQLIKKSRENSIAINIAVKKHITSLEESLDALSDILMAEAVHQYANGNIERAASVLKSLSEGYSPPVPEFVQTNRSGQHHITHRVCVLMKKSNTVTSPVTPRAQAAPELNRWIKEKIGALNQIKFKVFEKYDDEKSKNERVINLSEFNLQPIDLIYIVPSGLITGDTPVPVGNEEWGKRIAKIYKDKIAGAAVNNSKIWVDYDKATTGIRFSEKYFMLLKLRELVSNARPLHGGDLTNPVKEYELVQLKAKYGSINKNLNDLKYADDSIKDLLKTLSDQDYPKDYTAEKVEQTKDIVNILQQASLYGYTDANAGINPDLANNPMAVVMAYVSTRKAIEARINEADDLLNFDIKTPLEEKVEKYLKAIRLLFNETVCPLPHFKLVNASKINEVDSKRTFLLKEAVNQSQKRTEDIVLDDWIDGLHHVRPHIGTYRWIRLLTQRSNNSNPGLKVWQLPYNKDDRWLGVQYSTPQSGNKTSLVVESQDAVNNTDAFCGLLIDEWVETIPTKEETTGIAFNYNKPNAEPPQALLLAVPSDPSSGEWGLPEIARSVLYALKLSAIRGIDQDTLTQSAWRAFLPAVVGETAEQFIAPILFKNNEL